MSAFKSSFWKKRNSTLMSCDLLNVRHILPLNDVVKADRRETI